MWLTINTVACKALTIISQLVLGWFLAEEDFGKIGLAYTITGFAGLLVNPGVDTLLVQRQKHIRRWVTPAFWMSLTFGCLGGLLMLVAAPVGARLYDEPQLVGLVVILAIAAPLGSLSTIPNAILNARMQFRLFAAISFVNVLATSFLTIIFASPLFGFGAYSFILPIPIVHVLSAVMVWALVRPQLGRHPQLRRWRYMFGDAAGFWGCRLVWTAISQGDYIMLGLLSTKEQTGVYFFGYLFANQVMRVATGNLYGVMFPSLSRMGNDRLRQAQAAYQACRMVPYVLIPLCFIQGGAASWVLGLIYGSKWDGAAPVIELLTAVFAVYPILFVAEALAHSQRRFKLYYGMMSVAIPLFYVLVGVGAWVGSAWGAATGVSIYILGVTPILVSAIFAANGTSLSSTLALYLPPLVAAAIALLAGGGISWALSLQFGWSVAKLVGIAGVATVTFLLWVYCREPDVLRQLQARFRRV